MAVRLRLPLLLSLGVLLLSGCVPAEERPSWRVYALPRQRAGDGLAVVNRPGGEGLHLWLDVRSGQEGPCRPRWNPDGARLRDGNGERPTSMGRAPREEFFEALGHGRVRLALRQQMELLCRQVAPGLPFAWQPPPRRPQALPPERPRMLQEPDLLSHPTAVRRAEKLLLGQPLKPEDWDDKPLPPPPQGP